MLPLRKFDRETLQQLSQVLGHMHMEANPAPAVFNNDPGDLYLTVFGGRDVSVRITPAKPSKSGKNGMLLRLYGLTPAAVTVFHTKNPGDFVPSIVKALAGLMARAYSADLHAAELQQEIDNAE